MKANDRIGGRLEEPGKDKYNNVFDKIKYFRQTRIVRTRYHNHPSRGSRGGRVTVWVWKDVRTVDMVLVSRTVVVMGLALKITR